MQVLRLSRKIDTFDIRTEGAPDAQSKVVPLNTVSQVRFAQGLRENAFFENFANFWRARSRLYK